MLAVIVAIALTYPPVQANIGPQPTMEEFIALAGPALASEMEDAQSVTFKWPYQLVAGSTGYSTCGLVDTLRNKPERKKVWVLGVVANGRVVDTQWSTRNGMLAWSCETNVRQGRLVKR